MAGPVAGRNRTAASRSACHSSSVRSISAAATLLSSCATLDAPGIATTAGLLISQASATCEKPASCASATSRSTRSSPAARSWLTGRNSALNDLTRFRGRFDPS